jgi:hypothetical protein
VSSQSGSNAQVKPAIEWGEGCVKSFDIEKCLGVDQHASLANTQDITETVVLGLIKFSFGQSNPLAEPGHGLPHFPNHPRTMGHPLFGASHSNQGCALDAHNQLLQGVWLRRGVIA